MSAPLGPAVSYREALPSEYWLQVETFLKSICHYASVVNEQNSDLDITNFLRVYRDIHGDHRTPRKEAEGRVTKRWTPEEEQFVRDNYGKMHIKEIAEKLGRKQPAAYSKARDMGLTRLNSV